MTVLWPIVNNQFHLEASCVRKVGVGQQVTVFFKHLQISERGNLDGQNFNFLSKFYRRLGLFPDYLPYGITQLPPVTASQVNAFCLNLQPDKPVLYSIYLPLRDGRLS